MMRDIKQHTAIFNRIWTGSHVGDITVGFYPEVLAQSYRRSMGEQGYSYGQAPLNAVQWGISVPAFQWLAAE